MSSSKFQDTYYPAQQASPSSLRPRNQSEPPSAQQQQQMLTQSSDVLNRSVATDTLQSSSPISRRSLSSYTLPADAPIPRLCRVRAYEEQLGFTIAGSKTNRGVFKISDVAPNSPAAHSGLQNDDYLIEISGVNVESMNYSDVVSFIKSKKQDDDLQLLVADRATLLWYKSKRIPISSQIVPKMQYIETLLKEELDREPEYNPNSEQQYVQHHQ
jgi:C-terminal processing protease CtpA/Prc